MAYRPRPAVKVGLAALAVACVAWTCGALVFYLGGGLRTDPGYGEVIRGVFRLLPVGR